MNISMPTSQFKHFPQTTGYLKHRMEKKGPNVMLRKYDNHFAAVVF